MHSIKQYYKQMTTSLIFRMGIIIFGLCIIGSVSIFYLESHYHLENNKGIGSLGEAIWWTIVTITTVGYGDYTPLSPGGRIVAILIMISGIGMISVITGSIATMFTTQKLREGRGLETLKIKNHVIICGWNRNIKKLLTSISAVASSKEPLSIAMVNNENEEQMSDIISHFNSRSINIKFVSGDHSNETVLNRANITDAKTAILLFDEFKQDDDQTVMTTLTIKNLKSKIYVIAYVSDLSKQPFLKRAGANAIISHDSYGSYMAAAHLLEPGVPQAVDELTDVKSPHRFRSIDIPDKLYGQTFQSVRDYFKDRYNGICIGIFTHHTSVGISDLLSAKSNSLDAFIERKLTESGHSLGEEDAIDIMLNPGDDYIIEAGQGAIYIP